MNFISANGVAMYLKPETFETHLLHIVMQHNSIWPGNGPYYELLIY